MAWVVFYVAIGVVGIAVLGAVGFRLYKQVRAFMRDVKAASDRIAALNHHLAQESAARAPRA